MENSLGPIVMLFMLGFMVLMIASVWKVFTKAGQPGWAAIIPFYNLYIMVKIAGKPGWWTLLIIFLPLIPILGAIASIVLSVMVMIELAKAFGKGTGFALGLVFLGFIFFPILGFGDAQYAGTAVAEGVSESAPDA